MEDSRLRRIQHSNLMHARKGNLRGSARRVVRSNVARAQRIFRMEIRAQNRSAVFVKSKMRCALCTPPCLQTPCCDHSLGVCEAQPMPACRVCLFPASGLSIPCPWTKPLQRTPDLRGECKSPVSAGSAIIQECLLTPWGHSWVATHCDLMKRGHVILKSESK